MEAKERIMFWDILKGYAVISVVLSYSHWVVTPCFSAYYIPLLFFCCICSYNEVSYLNNPFGFAGKLIKTYWVKYVFYMFLFVIFHNVGVKFGLCYSIEPYTFSQTLRQILFATVFSTYEPYGEAMWFVLPMITAGTFFAVSVTLSDRISKIFVKNRTKRYLKYFVLILIAIVVAICATVEYQISFKLHIAFLMLPICIVAYFVKLANVDSVKKALNIFVALFFGGLIYIFVTYTGYSSDIAVNAVPSKIWYYIIAFLGIYMCMAFAKYTERIPYFGKAIALVGKHSFSVVALCLISIKLCDRTYGFITGEKDPAVFGKWICAYTDKMWWVYIIAGIVLPVVFGWLINKLKVKIEGRIKSDA